MSSGLEPDTITETMPSQRNEHFLTWVLPCLLISVFLVLATLQYRWSEQASDAAMTRINAGLQDSMMNLREDLSRQFSVLCLELQSESTAPIESRRLSGKLEHWQKTSSYPDLVSDIYLWAPSDGGRLLHLLPGEARFENGDWPADMDDARQTISASIAALGKRLGSAQTSSLTEPSQGGRPDIIGGIDEGIPLLLVPASAHSHSAWFLIKLDTNRLRNRVFADLAAKYFGSNEFAVTIVAANAQDGHVLYSSDARLATSTEIPADGTLNLFGPPFWKGAKPQAAGHFLSHEQAVEPAMVVPSGGISVLDPIQIGKAAENWQIVAKHRKGSVQAAVTALRYRNLALSFFVLLILAASVALTILSGHQARRLARLQMGFVAGVSHELRTPVAAILSVADNIASGVVKDEGKFAYYGDLVRKQARLLNHFVEQVLRFSATRTSAVKTNPQSFHISEALDEALANTASVITSSGVDVRCEIDPNVPDALGDPMKLSLCIQNLITNAVKYSGASKSIDIGVHAAPNGSAPGQIQIEVSDSGIGIDPDYVKHIFKPFYRSPTVAESPIHGTGLGLALTKSYIESMGGDIEVTTELNKGTTFILRVPAAQTGGDIAVRTKA